MALATTAARRFFCRKPGRERAWKAAGVATFLVLAGHVLPQSKTHRTTDSYERAVEMRSELEALPPGERTRERFEPVLGAFRAVYHGDPGSGKAPAAVTAVAELLAEKGRALGDPRILRSAIGQYEYLRQQYPNSPQMETALLQEGEICRQDLKDTACAREKLQGVLDAEPGTSFAEQAALELKEMDAENAPPVKPDARSAKRGGPQIAAGKASAAKGPDSVESVADFPEVSAPPAPTSSGKNQSGVQAGNSGGRTVAITGIRHWSNPTSTRIAIDLAGKVEYEAARVPNPDRIFFDLHGARLAQGVGARPVEVVDDGYLKRIRIAQFQPGVTRVVLDVTDVSEYSAFLLPNPWRLIVDIHSDKGKNALAAKAQPAKANPTAGDNTVADVARLSSDSGKVAATDGPTSGPVSAKVAPAMDAGDADAPTPSSGTTSAPARRRGKKAAAAEADAAPDPGLPHAADPTADGQRSLVRALGLKVGRIVIDAGHGGHDSGTLGPGGIEEKDVVLDVALRVGKLLHQRLGAEIVYTRADDTFIPLETRTAIANKAQADLFLSIHANSSPEESARGVEAYYLNFTSDPNALDVAARENAVSNQSVHQLSDLVRKITLKDKIDESREFAEDVDAGLYEGLKTGNPGLKDRGVKKAPFVVLIGAQMPSILAEISFLTNPNDARQLRDEAYRERIAESLDAGVERYLKGLSGMRPSGKNAGKRSAQNVAKNGDPAGQ